ncbi:hypothetical protein DNTS_015720 [Danionella cerebrum]|uniref:Uncharacterized protein n=1 Tax=Danionella cerebrum TaxID=2873325 RepID=A0A553QD15_9TELE|nr:hypothetical protein DNTS_015720 [Danionella translucida]
MKPRPVLSLPRELGGMGGPSRATLLTRLSISSARSSQFRAKERLPVLFIIRTPVLHTTLKTSAQKSPAFPVTVLRGGARSSSQLVQLKLEPLQFCNQLILRETRVKHEDGVALRQTKISNQTEERTRLVECCNPLGELGFNLRQRLCPLKGLHLPALNAVTQQLDNPQLFSISFTRCPHLAFHKQLPPPIPPAPPPMPPPPPAGEDGPPPAPPRPSSEMVGITSHIILRP